MLENWNYNLKQLENIDAQLTEIVTFEEDGDFFIRGKGDSWSSTVILEVDAQGKAFGAGIACTSKECASDNTKCVPTADKKACTKCGPFVSDCTKTVTAIAIFQSHLDY